MSGTEAKMAITMPTQKSQGAGTRHGPKKYRGESGWQGSGGIQFSGGMNTPRSPSHFLQRDLISSVLLLSPPPPALFTVVVSCLPAPLVSAFLFSFGSGKTVGLICVDCARPRPKCGRLLMNSRLLCGTEKAK